MNWLWNIFFSSAHRDAGQVEAPDKQTALRFTRLLGRGDDVDLDRGRCPHCDDSSPSRKKIFGKRDDDD
jgi:hypothetical protein